jgi:hypothetical protein
LYISRVAKTLSAELLQLLEFTHQLSTLSGVAKTSDFAAPNRETRRSVFFPRAPKWDRALVTKRDGDIIFDDAARRAVHPSQNKFQIQLGTGGNKKSASAARIYV